MSSLLIIGVWDNAEDLVFSDAEVAVTYRGPHMPIPDIGRYRALTPERCRIHTVDPFCGNDGLQNCLRCHCQRNSGDCV